MTNHNGRINLAQRLIDAAIEAKADAVKFQAWKRDRFPELASYRLEYTQIASLKSYAEYKGIQWFCTPFDFESIDFLNELGMDIWKIPSGMMTNHKYLEKIKSIAPRVLLSTGMTNLDEIKVALRTLGWWRVFTPPSIILLHCITAYPAPIKECNLKAIQNLIKLFGNNIGLSDHTLGIEIPIAAVAMGASVIEKHITLDRKMEGPDHKASLEPDEFKEMVRCIRNVELALSGDGIKQPTPSELKVRDQIRKRMEII